MADIFGRPWHMCIVTRRRAKLVLGQRLVGHGVGEAAAPATLTLITGSCALAQPDDKFTRGRSWKIVALGIERLQAHTDPSISSKHRAQSRTGFTAFTFLSPSWAEFRSLGFSHSAAAHGRRQGAESILIYKLNKARRISRIGQEKRTSILLHLR